MKMTREQFKEYVQLYQETWDKFSKYSDYFNEELLSELLFPLFDWVSEQAGLREEDSDFDVLADLTIFERVPVNVQWFDLPDGEKDYTCEYTTDLDAIYDFYFGEE